MSLHSPRPVLRPLRAAALAPALLAFALVPAFAAPAAPAMPAAPSPGDTMALLFADRSFGGAGEGGLTWRLERHGPAAEGFRPITGGRLTLGPATDPADGKPLLELREASEGLDRVVARYPATGVDPVLIYFLENATRGMAAIAGGNPDYIRNRIKEALRRGGAVIDRGDGGRTVILTPFAGDPNAPRMAGFDRLTLVLGLGPDPGAPIRSLEAEAPGTGYALRLVEDRP